MLRRNPSGHRPQVHESAYVDHTAILCGKVIVHENVFIGPYAVIRADEVNEHGEMEAIVIGAHSNIQDGVVIHSKSGAAVTIGERSSIAHRAIVHGPCTVGDGAFIGFTACSSLQHRRWLRGASQRRGRWLRPAARFLRALHRTHRSQDRPGDHSARDRGRFRILGKRGTHQQ